MIAFWSMLVLAQPYYPEQAKEYWEDTSVIYAQVESVAKQQPGEYLVTMRPQATLSGSFDPGMKPRIKVRMWTGAFYSDINEPPRSGENVIAVIGPSYGRPGEYKVTGKPVTFMPIVNDRNRPGVLRVKEFSDPMIAATIAVIQERREGHASEVIPEDKQDAFWDYHSLLYAEVGEVSGGLTHYVAILRPKATMFGRFDSSDDKPISVIFPASATRPRPRENSRIAVMILNHRLGSQHYEIVTEPMMFVGGQPAFRSPLLPPLPGAMNTTGYIEVEGFDDPKVEMIRTSIAKFRAQGKPVPYSRKETAWWFPGLAPEKQTPRPAFAPHD